MKSNLWTFCKGVFNLKLNNALHLQRSLLLVIFLSFFGNACGQYSYTTLGSTYSQDFNNLRSSGTSGAITGGSFNNVNTSLNGWYFDETGSGANTRYTGDTGGAFGGDTYSYGTAAVDRALGGLRSSSVAPRFGFYFTNNTGSTITQLIISYTGEQYRLGATGRTDKIEFSYSNNATSLSTGTWTNVTNLDFTAPVTTGSTGVALNGNLAANKTAISHTITGLSISNGSSIFIRWADFDVPAGSEDGLSIDDISIVGNVSSPCTTPNVPTLATNTITSTGLNLVITPPVSNVPTGGYLVVRSTSATPPTVNDGAVFTTGGAYTVVSNGTTTNIAQTGLASNTQYYYYVYSQNTGCTGTPFYSSVATISPVTCAAAPTGVSVSAITSSGANFTWTNPTGGGSAAITSTLNIYSNSTYTTLVTSVPSVSSVYTLSTLSPSTTYWYQVVNSNGACSSSTNGGSFTTACAVPNNPGAIVVSNPLPTGFTLTYAAASPTPESYILFASTGTAATATPTLIPGTTYVTGNTYTFGGQSYKVVTTNSISPQGTTGGTGNTQYNYFLYSVSTTNACFGNPYYSSGVTVSAITCPAPVTAPSVSPLGTTTATVSWTASAGGAAATINYTLEVYTNSNFTGAITGSPFIGSAVTQNLTGLTPSTPYYYRIKATNSSCDSTYLTGSFTTACITAVVTGTPAARCGTGTVALSASTDIAATVNWFTASTGGASVFTGNNFTTPSLSDTTDYYAEASVLGAVQTSLPAAPLAASGAYNDGTTGLVFDVTTTLNLNSVDVFNNLATASNLVVTLVNSVGTVLQTSPTFSVPGGSGTTAYTANLGWTIPIGTGYRLLVGSASTSYAFGRDSSLGGYPYNLGSAGKITGGYFGGATTSYYNFYNWKVQAACVTTPRTKVTATVNPSPTAVTITQTPVSSGGVTACDLDYVKLDVTGGTTLQTATSEDFSSGTGWSYNGSNGSIIGQYSNTNYAGGSDNFEAGLIWQTGNNTTIVRNYYFFKSTPINTTAYKNLSLSFKNALSMVSNYGVDAISVEVSTDNSSWTPVWTSSASASIAATTTVINLNAYIGNSTLYYRFRYTGYVGPFDYWLLDDILINGDVQQPITWTPTTGLFNDAALLIPYTGDARTTVYAAPETPQVYTATALPGPCVKTVMSSSIQRTKKVFTGADATNPTLWNVDNNWSTKTIPTSDKCVNIPSGKTAVVNITTAVAKKVTVDAGGYLTISPNQALTVTDVFTNSNVPNLVAASSPKQYYVTIENDGNLLQTNKVTNVGAIAARREINIRDHNQYNYAVSPLLNTNLNTNIYEDQTSHNLSNAPFTLYHNEATNKFYTSSGAYIAGRGLAVKEPATGTGKINMLFTGVPVNGSVPYTLVNSTPLDAVHGYNLIGNPYPSNLDLITFYNENNTTGKLDPTFYFWDSTANSQTSQAGSGYGGEAYAKFNVSTPPGVGTPTIATGDAGFAGTKSATRYVKVGQAFMARTTAGSLAVSFENTQRTGNSATGFFGKGAQEAAPFDRYWLNMISPANIISELAVVYFEGGNDAYTQDDSRSLLGSDAVYSIVEGQPIAINGKNSFAQTDVVPLGTKHFANGNYTIALKDQKDGVFANGQSIYLKDKQTGIITNLSEGNYTFAAIAGENTGRFEIIYQPEIVLATDGIDKEQIIVYRENNDFIIKSPKEMERVEVYDPSGKLIKVLLPNSKSAVIESTTLINGMYILKIELKDGEQYMKKIRK